MKSYSFISLLILTFLPVGSCFAQRPDFILKFKECSSVIGYLNQADFPLKKFDLPGSTYACTRASRKITCQISFDDGGKSTIGDTLEYELAFETSSQFDMHLEKHGDYISINTASHTAVVVSRAMHETFLGSKVCRGIYLTADEAEYLSKEFSKEKR